jgi:REP element-mobilizing transposase RayT
MNLPRFHIERHIYYITTNLYTRLPIFTRPSFIIPLYDSLNFYRYQLLVKILGYVFMPDHIHLLVWPYGTATISDFMRDFKEFTAKRIVRQAQIEGLTEWTTAFAQGGEETGRGQNKVWQDSYWDTNVFTQRFLRQKLNYIHRNPLRAGLVDDVAKYLYSSYRNYEFEEEWGIEVDRGWLF